MNQFKTLAEFKALNKSIGNHFFDRKTMSFFRSRIESSLIKGRYFITSESDMRNTERFFNVREANEDGSVNTVIPFNTLKNKRECMEEIEDLEIERRLIANREEEYRLFN